MSPRRDPPRRNDVRLGAPRAGLPSRCPYCRTELGAEARAVVVCTACRAQHHGGCWAESRACAACGATPPPPLERFRAVYEALDSGRGWEGAMPLRRSALTLATIPGPPDEIASELRALAKDLKQRAGWFGNLNSPIRFVVAALLLRGGITAEEFERETEALRAELRQVGMRRGNVYEVIASLVLQLRGQRAPQQVVRRLQELYEMMKSYHWWLTGPDDFPACALLALSEEDVGDIGRRIEWFFGRLRQEGFSWGSQLQLVSHLLYFNPREDEAVIRSFQRIYAEFKARGLWMFASDYDEVALLTFLDQDPAEVVDRVLAHRAEIAKLKPKPDRGATFSLACSTAFLELARASEHDLTDVKALIETQAIIAAQQAAAAAAAGAAGS